MKKNWASTDIDNPSISGAQGSGGDESTLFSLSTLKAKAAASAPAGHAREDNSGVIDLKALMEKAEREEASRAAADLHVAPLIPVYPFGPPVEAEPTTQTTSLEAATVSPPSPPRRSRPRFVGAAAIACAVLGVSATAAAAVSAGLISFGTVRAAQAASAPTTLQWTVASSLVELAPDATPATETPAAPAAEELAAKSSPKVARPVKAFPHVAQAPVINRPQATPKAAPAKAPTKASASDACKGDLMCAMQRAVKK